MARMVADCRDYPSENNCSLTIAGEEEEVLDVAVAHAISHHGHAGEGDLRDMIRSGLKPE